VGYLSESEVKIRDDVFKVRELTYSEFREVLDADESVSSLVAIKHGCEKFKDADLEEIGKLPARYVARISTEIVRLSSPEDAEGN